MNKKETNIKRITLVLDKEILEAIEQQGGAIGLNRSTIVHLALKAHYKNVAQV